MAHSYFGDAVVIRDYAHAWLKESWASYMEYCWVESAHGADEAAFYMSEEVREYRGEADGRYPAAHRHALVRLRVGHVRHAPLPGRRVPVPHAAEEARRARSGRASATTSRPTTAKTADTADFQRCLEARSGLGPARFFDQWLYAAGYPKAGRPLSPWDNEKNVATVTPKRRRPSAPKGVGRFDPPAHRRLLKWPRESGSASPPTSATAAVTARTAAARPKAVVLDPDGDLVFGLEWSPGDDPHTRVARGDRARAHQAARASARANAKPSPQFRRGVPERELLGVRVEIARSLAAAGTQAAVDALAALLPVETDDRVRAHLTALPGLPRCVGGEGGSARRSTAKLGYQRPRGGAGGTRPAAGDAHPTCSPRPSRRGLLGLDAARRDGGARADAEPAAPRRSSKAWRRACGDPFASVRRRPRLVLGRWLTPRDRASCVERLADLARPRLRDAPRRSPRARRARRPRGGRAFLAAERAAAVQDVARIRCAARCRPRAQRRTGTP